MAKKILIVGPAWVGDMVMAQSLFRLLKAQNPGAQLDVLAPAWTFSLLNRMPEVAHALTLPFIHGELNLRGRWRLAKTLRGQYDQAIVLPNSFKAALIPWFARIPLRTGWLGECRYGVLNDARSLDKAKYPLMVDQFMALGLPAKAPLPALLPPRFAVTAQSQAAALAKYQLQVGNNPILALCPGAEFGPAKRWPETHFAEVAKQKLSEGWAVWLFGSKKDRVLTDNIMSLTNNRCENLAGLTELADSIDLLSLASGVVSNDSGLMHIAAALEKPIVALFGSTSPTFTPPLTSRADILSLKLPCQPCFKRECPLTHYQCLRELKSQQVLTAIQAWGI